MSVASVMDTLSAFDSITDTSVAPGASPCSTGALLVLVSRAATAVLLDAKPTIGPIDGGAHVRVSGLMLGLGSLYLCRFGASVVNATFAAMEGTVTCVAPPHLNATVPLQVSLNGKHYEQQAFDFTFHEEVLLSENSSLDL